MSEKRKQKYELQSERLKLNNPNSKITTECETAIENDNNKTSEMSSENILSGRRIVKLNHLSRQLKCDKCERVLDLQKNC